MKIVHLFSSKVFAGLERHVEELSFEQSKTHEVTVIGPNFFSDKFRCNYMVIDTNAWRFSPFLRLKLNKTLSRLQPNIVHTHGQKMTSVINADLHFSTIHGTKKNISALKSTILENWVDETRFQNFRKLSPEFFLYLGRLEPVKNPQRLIRAWQGIDKKLLIVGNGQLKDQLITLIKELGLTKTIEIQDETDDVSSLLSKASALLIPSDREGSPKVLYESLFCKVPVLSTDCGNIADVLPNESVSRVSDSDFRDLIKRWVNNYEELYSSQIETFKYVAQNNVLAAQALRVNKVYQEFLSKASK
jgi:glycosyltransferase involved in cell wall biosynthesis